MKNYFAIVRVNDTNCIFGIFDSSDFALKICQKLNALYSQPLFKCVLFDF